MTVWILLMTIFLSNCATKQKATDENAESSDTPPAFEAGLRALEQERYAEAAEIFDGLLVAKPATEVDLVTSFNSGAAHEGLGDCKKASERYREVTRSSAGKFLRIEAQAFFRLSVMYECLGQEPKAISALLDARKRGKELPYSTLQAEIPARLARSYARMNNRAKALEYFSQASAGLKKLVSQEDGRKQKEILSQTLFFMGQLNETQRRGEGNPVVYLQGLSMQQPYLLQAVELAQAPWAKRAATDLETAYDNMWRYSFADAEQRRDFYVRVIQVSRELKKIRLPKADPNLDAIFARVDKTESRAQVELSRAAETNRLTPDAEKREGLRRAGRLVAPPKPAASKKR